MHDHPCHFVEMAFYNVMFLRKKRLKMNSLCLVLLKNAYMNDKIRSKRFNTIFSDIPSN